MLDALNYLLLIAILGGAVFAGLIAYRSYTGAALPGMALFAAKPVRRLDIVEQTSVDGRRKLLLVRRDEVEHLIMTGGPVDVVIETGIGLQTAPRRAPEAVEPVAPVYSRPARRFGQAVGE